MHYHGVPSLSDIVVLDPRWLTVTVLGPIFSPTKENLTGIDTLIKNEQQEDGTFKLDAFLIHLAPSGPSWMADAIVEMMVKMELCVKRTDSILIPALLKVLDYI